MKRAVIIGGGIIEEAFALRFLQEKEHAALIAADKGLLFLKKHGIRPTHIVGDFDSVAEAEASFPEAAGQEKQREQYGAASPVLSEYAQDPAVTIRKFQPEKDWTDMEIAATLAVEQGCGTIDILGGTAGHRVDHLMGNIQLLALMLEMGADCRLLDSRNCIYMRDHEFTVQRKKQWGTYFSLFAYGGEVTGLTLEGMKYPLDHFTLGTVGTRGVSNEVLEETARIRFESGRLLVMETRD